MPANSPTELVQCNPYLVSSSEGAIFVGDVVTFTTLDTVRAVTGAYTPTSSGLLLGVAAQTLAANGGSTAATFAVNSSQMVLVYDSPQQIFVGCDTTSGVIGSNGIGKNYAVLATGCTGSTGNNTSLGRSVMALSGVTASSGGAFKVIGLHPVESAMSTVAAATAGATTEVRKWLIIPAAHVYLPLAQAAAGAWVNTTS
jgi:hypothetical protein